ncbi:MAG: glycosyltransferase family 2 protein, partial [Candidatus Saccharimonadales bacterium]
GSRSTVIRNFKVFRKQPAYISKRAATLIFTDTKKLANTVLGRRELSNFKDLKNKQLETYGQWIEAFEKKTFNAAKERQQSASFAKKPLISLITPVFNPPLDALEDLIKSVLDQTYGNFELLLFDFSTNKAVDQLINQYAAKDKRVIVQIGLDNKGISANSDYILKYATGEFVGLLDHDDLVEPNLLFECVKVINENKHEVDFIYTDKDKITEDNGRFDPQFKPDFSPEMLLTANYLTHFDLMRKSLVDEVGGWDTATDGAQDWDLFLKLTNKSDKIVHIPKILYHWRTVKNSTANSIDVKPYVRQAQLLTINRALNRQNFQGASAWQAADGQMYVKWPKKSQKTAFFVHGIFLSQKVEKLIQHIQKQPDHQAGSPIYYFVLTEDIKDPYIKHLEKKLKNLKVIRYEAGEFLSALTDVGQSLGSDVTSCVYLTDSVKKVQTSYGYWISQLTNWLSVDQIGLVGGSSEHNQAVIDCGSVFDKKSNNFINLFTGGTSAYELIGYSKWTRNLLAPSKRIYAFKPQLLTELPKVAVRDDEVALLAGLVTTNKGQRVVYDAGVHAVDKASFLVSLGLSEGLKKFMAKHTPTIVEHGDPYLSTSVEVTRLGLALKESGADFNREQATDAHHIKLVDL